MYKREVYIFIPFMIAVKLLPLGAIVKAFNHRMLP